jgi:hypothetical protein
MCTEVVTNNLLGWLFLVIGLTVAEVRPVGRASGLDYPENWPSSCFSFLCPRETAFPSCTSWKLFRHGFTSFLAIIPVFVALWKAVLGGGIAKEWHLLCCC